MQYSLIKIKLYNKVLKLNGKGKNEKIIKSGSLFLLLVSAMMYAKETKNYGEKITLKEKTSISKILENPEAFVGKKVLVEGTVVDVCEKRGCWINLSSDKEFESIRIKVNDGEIVFPMETKGQKALVEGEVYSMVVEGEGCGR